MPDLRLRWMHNPEKKANTISAIRLGSILEAITRFDFWSMSPMAIFRASNPLRRPVPASQDEAFIPIHMVARNEA